MPRYSARLGDTLGSLMTTLTGGRNYNKAFTQGASDQSAINLQRVQQRKVSVETQKLIDQLSANSAARKMTVKAFGPGWGFTPNDIAQYRQHLATGKYTKPFVPDTFPGENPTTLAAGLKQYTNTPPPRYTPQKARAISSVMQMLDLNKLTRGQSNAAQLASGAKTQNIEQMAATLLRGVATPKKAMQARAAAEGRNFMPKGQNSLTTLQKDIPYMIKPVTAGGLGLKLKDAISLKFPSQPTAQKEWLRAYNNAVRNFLTPDKAAIMADESVHKQFPKAPITIDPRSIVKIYK